MGGEAEGKMHDLLDAKTKGSMLFRNLRARDCCNLSIARALLRARGFLNSLDSIGRGV